MCVWRRGGPATALRGGLYVYRTSAVAGSGNPPQHAFERAARDAKGIRDRVADDPRPRPPQPAELLLERVDLGPERVGPGLRHERLTPSRAQLQLERADPLRRRRGGRGQRRNVEAGEHVAPQM